MLYLEVGSRDSGLKSSNCFLHDLQGSSGHGKLENVKEIFKVKNKIMKISQILKRHGYFYSEYFTINIKCQI